MNIPTFVCFLYTTTHNKMKKHRHGRADTTDVGAETSMTTMKMSALMPTYNLGFTHNSLLHTASGYRYTAELHLTVLLKYHIFWLLFIFVSFSTGWTSWNLLSFLHILRLTNKAFLGVHWKYLRPLNVPSVQPKCSSSWKEINLHFTCTGREEGNVNFPGRCKLINLTFQVNHTTVTATGSTSSLWFLNDNIINKTHKLSITSALYFLAPTCFGIYG
jgi:hypothetical protein